MQGTRHFTLANILVLAIFTITAASVASAATYQVIYSFGAHPDGAGPEAGLVFDSAGNLYGTTIVGGAMNQGAVYELSPAQGGGWSEKVIYNFTGGADGGNPVSTLVLDAGGNLYGTASHGGSGQGVVFELSPSGGSWTETVLHAFAGGSGDGTVPLGGVIFDGFGNLIGTASTGGSKGFGVVFQLSPSGGGWTETIIHSFTGGNDEIDPRGKLSMDRVGRIYGTTVLGSTSIYRLSRSRGLWHYKQLWCFCNGGGEQPYGGVAIDRSYHVFGTTYVGTNGLGNVFRLTPGTHPVLKVIYTFTGKSDGSNPDGGVVLDSLGRIWGTASFGGSQGDGVAFNLALVNGQWTEATIHSFGGTANSDGAYPITDLIFDVAGNLYGTTYKGGQAGAGVVFGVTP